MGSIKLCSFVSKDEICDKHFCPSNECGNLSCTEGLIGTPSDHKIQENFIQYGPDKKNFIQYCPDKKKSMSHSPEDMVIKITV